MRDRLSRSACGASLSRTARRKDRRTPSPPQIATIGELPELFYEPKRPFAADLVQKLAWAEAFRRLPEEQTSRVVRRVPDPDDFDGWLALGELLWRQHTELAAEGRDFADVARAGQQVEGFDEQDRWEALATVQNTYLRMLDALELWDRPDRPPGCRSAEGVHDRPGRAAGRHGRP